jgi:hypothetical protein
MQAGVNLWEGIIDATGGAISVEKSQWWLMDFLWVDNGEYTDAKIADLPEELAVKDFDGIVEPIQWMEPDEAFEILGLWIAADRSLDRQFEMLLAKVKKWADKIRKKWSDKIRTSFLRKNDPAYALKVTVLKKIEYCLPALNLSKS